MAKHSVEEIEKTGKRAKFMAFGGERDGWIMPDGCGVVCREYGQLVFHPDAVSDVRYDIDTVAGNSH